MRPPASPGFHEGMDMLRKLAMILMVALAIFAGAAFAQSGPPVKIVIAFPPGGPVDFVDPSKQSPNPIPIASSGIGSMPHLAMELLADSSGAKLMHVPYKGAAPAITDVMGGQVSGFFGDIPGLIGFIRGGRLKPLGIAAVARHPLLPDVRTLDEQGIHGVESNNWYALFVPAKTPPARIDELNKAVRKVLTMEPYRTRLLDSGAEPVPGSAEELVVLVKTDTAKWGKIIKDKKIKGE